MSTVSVSQYDTNSRVTDPSFSTYSSSSETMAPYIMQVEVCNNTPFTCVGVGSSTYSGLDGTTHPPGYTTVNKWSTSKFSITKSGGGQGLFTALTWCVRGDGSGEDKHQFSVWSSMSAASDGEAIVRLITMACGRWDEYTIPEWADYCHFNPKGYRGGDAKISNGIKARRVYSK